MLYSSTWLWIQSTWTCLFSQRSLHIFSYRCFLVLSYIFIHILITTFKDIFSLVFWLIIKQKFHNFLDRNCRFSLYCHFSFEVMLFRKLLIWLIFFWCSEGEMPTYVISSCFLLKNKIHWWTRNIQTFSYTHTKLTRRKCLWS